MAIKIDRDMIVQVVTLAAVILGGGGNAVLTERGNTEREAEINRALYEIHDLHAAITEALDRQKRLEDMLSKLSKPPP